MTTMSAYPAHPASAIGAAVGGPLDALEATSPLITGHSSDGNSDLTLWSGDRLVMIVRVGEQIAFAPCPERWCVGVRRSDGSRETCERAATSGSFCAEHAARNRLLGCLACTPWACRNPDREAAACQQAHSVYLAVHGRTDGSDHDAHVKIGVAREDRFEARVREQGAFAALAVTRCANGQEARLFEHAARRLGWTDRLNIAGLAHLPHPDPAEAAVLLDTHIGKLRVRAPELPWRPCTAGVVTLGPYPAVPAQHGPLRALDIRTEVAAGVLVGRRGGHLILQTASPVQGTRWVTLAIRSLHGRRICSVDPEGALVGAGQQISLW